MNTDKNYKVSAFNAGVAHHSDSPVGVIKSKFLAAKPGAQPGANGKGREGPELPKGNAIKVSMHAVAQRNIFTSMRPQNRDTVEHSHAFAE
jgi:hypothetical protein